MTIRRLLKSCFSTFILLFVCLPNDMFLLPKPVKILCKRPFITYGKIEKKIEVTSSFRNLLITSVKNSCVDYLRKQSVRRIHSERQIYHENIDTPEEIYTVSELEEMLKTALDRLPPNVRKAFELSRFENMTYNKIAEEMDVSPKTVEAYISKALSVLRVELKDYLPLTLLFLY